MSKATEIPKINKKRPKESVCPKQSQTSEAEQEEGTHNGIDDTSEKNIDTRKSSKKDLNGPPYNYAPAPSSNIPLAVYIEGTAEVAEPSNGTEDTESLSVDTVDENTSPSYLCDRRRGSRIY